MGLAPVPWDIGSRGSSISFRQRRGTNSIKSDKRRRKDQARQDRFRASQMSRRQKKRMRQLTSGSKKFMKTLELSHEELRDGVKTFDRSTADLSVPRGVDPDLSAVAQASSTEAREINSLLQLLHEGGVGMLSQEKRAGWVRIMFENSNSIGIGTQNWKMERLNHLVKDLKIDIVAGCETNLDWRQLPESMMDLLSPGQAKKGTVAHNSTGDILHRNQRGDTMISAVGDCVTRCQLHLVWAGIRQILADGAGFSLDTML